MEQKSLIISALSVGVGVGLGLASGQAVSKWTGSGGATNYADQIELELRRLVRDGKDTGVSFENFPYYLRQALTHMAFSCFSISQFLLILWVWCVKSSLKCLAVL